MSNYIISLLISLLLISCNNNLEPTIYPFKGVVIDIFSDKQKMMIKHDEVSGFMMAMTMMFNIDSSININNYQIGDSLNFNLQQGIIWEEFTFLTEIILKKT